VKPTINGAIAVVVVAWVALATPGCGSSVIDHQKVARDVQQNLRDSLNVSVRSVSCPSGLPVEPHSRFVCRVDAGGAQEIDAVLEVLNSGADIRLATLRRHGE
jgi:hypothetical protein